MENPKKNLTGYIPEEFERECRALNIPCGELFRYDFVSRLPDLSMVQIAYLGRELEVPRYLFPFAIECFERRQDRERAKARERELLEKKAYWERREGIKQARRQALREEFPKMFQRR